MVATSRTRQYRNLLVYLLLMTAMFALLEVSFTIQGSDFYLGDFQYVSNHLQIPRSVLPAVVFYFSALVFLHLAFTLSIWIAACALGTVVKSPWAQIEKFALALWLVGLLTVLVLNQQLYPNSKFADLTRMFFPPWIASGVCWFLSSFMLLIFASALGSLMIMAAQRSRWWVGLFVMVLCAWGYGNFVSQRQSLRQVADGASSTQPNIILIGIDSLRPDFVGYFNALHVTPHLDEFLNESTVFSGAITPLARTFPAWVSMLTGQYPKLTGARFDLINQSGLDYRQTLPAILHAHGYQTIFAMDETRFSNMTKAMGFDRLVTPPVGFNDFFLGTFNDFPLSNLVVNTRLGAWLFPYSYGNRAAFITYNPDSFLRLIKKALAHDRTQPLFLAVHFCLPHFPYFWAGYSHLSATEPAMHYQSAVLRADQQLQDFLNLATQQGLLKHSIVILMSDHGEALELPGDRVTEGEAYIPGKWNPTGEVPRFYPPSFETEKVNESAGHGTDVLGLTQYHSVLAFRLYGFAAAKPHLVPGLVSLMDIKPTVLGLLKIAAPDDNGVSLENFIAGKKLFSLTHQDFFVESDFSPEALHSVHPEIRMAVFEGLDFFEVDPLSTTLTVKPDMGAVIISTKQFADIRGGWMLALYPQHKGLMMPVLINLQTGKWTNDLQTHFARHSPARSLLRALKKFYGTDITTIENS